MKTPENDPVDANRPVIIRLTEEQFERFLNGGAKVAEAILEADQDGNSATPGNVPVVVSDADGTAKPPIEGKGVSDNAAEKIIVDKVANFLSRFVFLQDQTHYKLIAVWIIATHMPSKFEYAGYLFAYSPERRSGKSTFLEVLSLLVFESTGLQISPTPAVIFRTATGRTHLMDEVDSWKHKDDLRDVLNAGFKKGGVVTRCDKGKGGAFKPTTYPVFAPRALAGIGLSVLHSTTLDRTFALTMVRQKKDEKRERSRERKIGPEAKALKAEIEKWVKANETAVAAVYDKAEFPYLDCFSDRTIDIAEPLAAIVEVAYKGKSGADQAIKDLVHAIASTRKEQHSVSNDHVLLKHLLSLAENEDPLVGNATELTAMCANLETPVDSFTVTRVLRNYGFKTRSSRKNGDARYRYNLSKAELKEVVDRWVPETAEQKDDGQG